MDSKMNEELMKKLANANSPETRLQLLKNSGAKLVKLDDEDLEKINGGTGGGEETPEFIESLFGEGAKKCPECYSQHGRKTAYAMEMFGNGTLMCLWCGHSHNYVVSAIEGNEGGGTFSWGDLFENKG